MTRYARILACLMVTASIHLALAAEPAIRLWPGQAPGDAGSIGEEKDTTKPKDNKVAGKPVVRLGNVSEPTVTFHRANRFKNTGACVVVLPGGGYNILAMDLEGTEVCEWLNSIGVNAALVKYRVPKRPGLEKHTAALQDAQRAVGLVRQNAGEWKIDPKRIGVIGFSAGAHLSATLAASTQRTYPAVDEADRLSCRPDFAMLIYPAYLTAKDQISPEVAVTTNTPPMFMVMSVDDPINVENPLRYGLALKQAKVPFELHVHPKGGHGYGLRKTDNPLTHWADRATDWMKSQGYLDKK